MGRGLSAALVACPLVQVKGHCSGVPSTPTTDFVKVSLARSKGVTALVGSQRQPSCTSGTVTRHSP